MRMLLHDLAAKSAAGCFGPLPGDVLEFAAAPAVNCCVGCFGCWTKTPGRCVIGDRARALPGMMAKSGEINIVSRCLYGGYSSVLKTSLDRCLPYIMPFFRIVNNEMHHTMRYDNPFSLRVFFYGPAEPQDRALAERLVAANALNFGAAAHSVCFLESELELRGVVV